MLTFEKIERMRARGYTFAKLVQSEKRGHFSNICRSIGKSGLTCKRHTGHRGVHLSDETGKLIYWE